MTIGSCHDLGQVGNDQDLVAGCQLGQGVGDAFGRPAPQTCVHLVKNEGADGVDLSQNVPLMASITRNSLPPEAIRAKRSHLLTGIGGK